MKQILKALDDIVFYLKSQKEFKKTFNVDEAAAYSGIGTDKIRELMSKQDTDFPFFKIGAKARIDKQLLDLWIEKVANEHRTI